TIQGQKKPRFSVDKVDALATSVLDKKAILYGKLSATINSKKKHEAWSAVAHEVSSVRGTKRDIADVKKKWQNICMEVKKKEAERKKAQKDTGCGSPPPDLTETEWNVPLVLGWELVQGIDGAMDTDAPLKKHPPLLSYMKLNVQYGDWNLKIVSGIWNPLSDTFPEKNSLSTRRNEVEAIASEYFTHRMFLERSSRDSAGSGVGGSMELGLSLVILLFFVVFSHQLGESRHRTTAPSSPTLDPTQPSPEQGNLNSSLTSQRQRAQMIRRLLRNNRLDRPQEGTVRLIGGKDFNQGNVEIFHVGRWGSICDDEWDDRDAQVVCRELGLPGVAHATQNSYFGEAKARIWMDNVYCMGDEETLSACRFDGWGINDCGKNEGAGVTCDALSSSTTSTSRTSSETLSGDMPVQAKKLPIKSFSDGNLQVRLMGGRTSTEGRVEVKHGDSSWHTVCGDGWGLVEAQVICRQLEFGYAADARPTDFFGGTKADMALSGVKCTGTELSLDECMHSHWGDVFCPGDHTNVAVAVCLQAEPILYVPAMPDLIPDLIELQRSMYLEDVQLWFLQCAMEENCLTSSAYKLQSANQQNWHLETRRLLRFTARIANIGTADFLPFMPKQAWQWHQCHMHYHSMELFARYDVMDPYTLAHVAEGHKASFCLEDNACKEGVEPVYNCNNFGDQGISVDCTDTYAHNIDCQWVDITDVKPGSYIFKFSINPEYKVGEMTFENNAITCNLSYSQTFAFVHNCTLGRP
ncbi:unnamed protein product, partial [Darwinula stevensoni]